MLQLSEVLQLLAAPTRSAAATCCKFAYMTLKLKYEKLESDDLLQIAAYMQHIYCKWKFSKNHKFNQDETQENVSLESILPAKFPDAAATRSAAATCCKIA